VVSGESMASLVNPSTFEIPIVTEDDIRNSFTAACSPKSRNSAPGSLKSAR
jgi:hypothetical protein